MNRGGARLGAGRKPKPMLVLRKAQAEQILGTVDEFELWRELLSCDDYRIRLDTLKYLTDRRDGKAPQTAVGGQMKIEKIILTMPTLPGPKPEVKPNFPDE